MDRQTSPMTAERWMQLKEIFAAVQGKPPGILRCKCARPDRGNCRLHVSGTDPGTSRRSAQRFIRRRNHSLRDVGRATPLASRIGRGYPPCHPSRRPAASPRHDPLGCAVGSHGEQAAGKESGGAVFARRRGSGSAQQLRGPASAFGRNPLPNGAGGRPDAQSRANVRDRCRCRARFGGRRGISYLGLARAYELAGDTVKARKAFQDFFALWKDADQDLPILTQAQAEYARLP